MTPQYANAIDPLFLYMLQTLERLKRNEAVDPTEIRDHVRNQFREIEAQLGQKPGWEHAKYALTAWVDEVMIDATWNGSEWWKNNVLEFEYFKTRDRAIAFFKEAEKASALTRRDSLEVFYLCVVLGFRGLYAVEDAPFVADQLELPTTLDAWAQKTARQIQLGQGRPTIATNMRQATGAPPLEGKSKLVASMFYLFTVSAVAVLVFYFLILKPYLDQA